ncbi:MAG TPA: helix-turn-helix transcriptional regulator [Solirubrobacterales bacterium]|jgi:DNA-binding CsgD family transcriptional regulator|nr:helix-turn-helix transcriptional regulator [Solirubrobacterales bacterium]
MSCDTEDSIRHAARVASDLPREVGAAAERALSARDDPTRLAEVLERSPVPMSTVDNFRRHVEVNRPARLLFRRSLVEMRRLQIEDLTPVEGFRTLETSWRKLMEEGCLAGFHEVDFPEGSRLDVVYWAVANLVPGRHLIVCAPAGWPDGELSSPVDGAVAPKGELTQRELEVLQLAAEGHSGPKIAERLVVTQSTVKTHFEHAYEKLGVADRAAAVARAMRLGLIE